ncbi:MAG TPA: rRNA maturation RNase YbeY [Bacteroidales bacterium]|nr:rRNA maturation RNase YbeY [Bacteroidales bacterium]HBZ65940.1 rRNA maturation RNase YbeY [Bacteroidales bacterium]
MKQSIENEMKLPGSVNFIFVSDEVLLKMNVQYLSHDSMTDVITFDYTEGSLISGDIFISIPRVRENAVTFAVPFIDELHRVMIHGVLHLMGYKDKTKSAKAIMSEKENFYLLNRW